MNVFVVRLNRQDIYESPHFGKDRLEIEDNINEYLPLHIHWRNQRYDFGYEQYFAFVEKLEEAMEILKNMGV